MMSKIWNYFGLYTREQYLLQEQEVLRAMEFSMYLEKAVTDMIDPAKPIIILSDCSRVENITLQHGQQIITSPFSKNVHVSNINVLPKRYLS